MPTLHEEISRRRTFAIISHLEQVFIITSYEVG